MKTPESQYIESTITHSNSWYAVLFQLAGVVTLQWAAVLTQCLLQLALVGMFEDEEVISGRIFGNPTGKFLRLCRFGVNQLNGLSVYVQLL